MLERDAPGRSDVYYMLSPWWKRKLYPFLPRSYTLKREDRLDHAILEGNNHAILKHDVHGGSDLLAYQLNIQVTVNVTLDELKCRSFAVGHSISIRPLGRQTVVKLTH